MIYKARMFELGIHFCPSLMFACLARVILDLRLAIDNILTIYNNFFTVLRHVLN